MNIVIYHSKQYDWQPCPDQAMAAVEVNRAVSLLAEHQIDSGKYSEGEVDHARAILLCTKQMHDNVWFRKIQCDSPPGTDYSQIGIAESQIDSLIAASKHKGTAMSRNQIVAHHLAERTLQHHTHPDYITAIIVDGEPDTSTFLESYFDVKKGG